MCHTRLMPTKTEKPKVAAKVPAKATKSPRKKAVNSLFFKFTGDDGIEYSLTKKQKLFVEHYLLNNTNGIEAAIAAGYDVQFKKNGKPTGQINRRQASAIASENLYKPDICAYITIKLDQYGFNDKNVEKQHLFLVNQNSDLANKRGALDMYYKLKGRYAPIETETKTTIKFENLNDDELDKAINAITSK